MMPIGNVTDLSCCRIYFLFFVGRWGNLCCWVDSHWLTFCHFVEHNISVFHADAILYKNKCGVHNYSCSGFLLNIVAICANIEIVQMPMLQTSPT